MQSDKEPKETEEKFHVEAVRVPNLNISFTTLKKKGVVQVLFSRKLNMLLFTKKQGKEFIGKLSEYLGGLDADQE